MVDLEVKWPAMMTNLDSVCQPYMLNDPGSWHTGLGNRDRNLDEKYLICIVAFAAAMACT